MRRVTLHLIALFVLANLPSFSHAQQEAAPPAPARTAAQRRRDKLADDLIRAGSATERDRVLAQNRRLLNAASVEDLIERGIWLRGQEYDQEALALFQSAQIIAERIHYTDGRIRAIWHTGFLYKLQENYVAALEEATQALALARQSKNTYQDAQCLGLFGDIYLAKGDFSAGLQHLGQSLALAERFRRRNVRAWADVQAWAADSLAHFYERRGNDAAAATYYSKALEAFNLREETADADATRRELADAFYRLSNYRQALKLYEASLLLLENKGAKLAAEPQAELLFQIYDCYVQLKDTTGIKKTGDRITSLMNAMPTKEAAFRIGSRTLHMQGNVLYQLGNYPDALSSYEKARSAAEQIKDKGLVSHALKGLGDAHLAQGNLDRAAQSYRQSLESIPAESPERALWLFRVGESYAGRERIAEASDYFNQSLKAAGKNDEALTAEVHAALAGLLMLQGDTRQALAELYECRRLYNELRKQHQLLLTMNRIAGLHAWTGDFRTAARILNEAFEQARGEGDLEAVAIIQSSLADNGMMQGDEEAAIGHLNKSMAAYDELQNRWGMAKVRFELGRLYLGQNRVADAVRIVREGMNMGLESSDTINMIKVEMFLGQAFMRQGDHDKALESFQKCHRLATKENITFMIGASQMLIGGVYVTQKRFDEALKEFEQARSILRQFNNEFMTGYMNIVTGFVYQALGRDEEALRAIAEGIAAMEEARLNVAGLEAEQVMFFARVVEAYRTMVQLHVKRNDVAEALLWADRSKARVLLDIMQHGAIDVAAAMSPQERARKESLEGRVATLNVQLQESRRGTHDAAQMAVLSARLQSARQELQEVVKDFYNAHPKLWRQTGHAPEFRVEDAAALLPDAETALLEYVVTDEEIFLFVLTREPGGAAGALSWKVHRIERPDGLALKVLSFRLMVSHRVDWFKPAARELYELLLKPAQEQLRGKTSIVIIPDSVLWSLPFQALQTPANRYLLEDYAVSYAPSLGTLRQMQLIRDERRAAGQQRERAQALLLALGDPSGVSPRLEETGEEVRGLKRIYGEGRSRVLVEAEATEERFKAEAGRYRVLHLATHGFLDAYRAMYSHVMLAPSVVRAQPRTAAEAANGRAPESGALGDGLLEAREVLGLQLNAELVILSMCESARGDVDDGEGLLGLTWAFFAAGAPTTVASQWKVNSRSTTELMLAFHGELLPGLLAADSGPGTSKALRGASANAARAVPAPLLLGGVRRRGRRALTGRPSLLRPVSLSLILRPHVLGER